MATIKLIFHYHRDIPSIMIPVIFILCFLNGFHGKAQELSDVSNKPVRLISISSGFALSPPSPMMPGAFFSLGLDQKFRKNISFSTSISSAYMEKSSYHVSGFKEKAFVVNWDLGAGFIRNRKSNTFGVLVGPTLRYFNGRSVGDRTSLGDGTVISYQVREHSRFYAGYHLGAYWDYQLNTDVSIGLQYRAFIFFDQFSNQTLGISIKKRL